MKSPNLNVILCLILSLTVSFNSLSQVSSMSIGSETVKNNAVLWLKAKGNQGLLLPVVNNRSAFTGLNNSDDRGMLIYDASDNKIYFWNGSAWIEAGGGGTGGGSNQTLTLNGNTFTLSGAPASNVTLSSNSPLAGQVLVWNGSTWVAASIAGDVTGTATGTVVSGLKGKAIPDLPGAANALVYNGTAWIFQPLSSAGEANTASNVGTAGVGVFKQKTGTNLEFQKLNAGSNRISVSQDVANNEIDIDVNQANLSIANTQVTGLGALATLSVVGSAQITDGSVTSADIANGTITGVNIANTTITTDKLAQSSATDGQVLRWNGTNWAPGSLSSGFSTLNIIPKGDGSALTSSQLFDNGTYVGLNRTSGVTSADRFSIGTNAASGSYGGMYVDTQAGGKPFYGFSQNGSAQAWVELDGSDGNKMKFIIGSARMTIQSNGNVGLGGMTSPNAQLQLPSVTSNRKIALYDVNNNDHQFYGFGVQAGEIRYQTQSNLSNHVFYAGASSTGSTELMRITGGGNVGIGTGPSYRLHVVGNSSGGPVALIENSNTSTTSDGLTIRLNNTATSNDYVFFERTGGLVQGRIAANGSGAVSYNTASDRRLKDNILDFTEGLSTVLKIRPRTYVFKSSPDVERIGFIAQELNKVFPEAVNGHEGGDPNTDPMMIDYGKVTPLLVRAIQEQQAQIEELKSSNKNLEKRLALLEALVTESASAVK